jgi:hypothetical protein
MPPGTHQDWDQSVNLGISFSSSSHTQIQIHPINEIYVPIFLFNSIRRERDNTLLRVDRHVEIG